jgi:hypothetical protein
MPPTFQPAAGVGGGLHTEIGSIDVERVAPRRVVEAVGCLGPHGQGRLGTGPRVPPQATSAWHTYWANNGLIEMNSSDGTAQYMENLRTLYLYDALPATES